MEAVGAAASIIAIIELTAKLTKLCKGYIGDVKSAESDQIAFYDRILATGKLAEKKVMKSLKWPLDKAEINKVISNLKVLEDTIQFVIKIDELKLVLCLAFSHDKKYLATFSRSTTNDTSVRVWDLATTPPTLDFSITAGLGKPTANRSPYQLVFSTNGQYLACVGYEGYPGILLYHIPSQSQFIISIPLGEQSIEFIVACLFFDDDENHLTWAELRYKDNISNIHVFECGVGILDIKTWAEGKWDQEEPELEPGLAYQDGWWLWGGRKVLMATEEVDGWSASMRMDIYDGSVTWPRMSGGIAVMKFDQSGIDKLEKRYPQLRSMATRQVEGGS
ncbi:hypothetical protein TWF102_005212 [Orbilia oligospora]|uniref:NACHT-NTPase and P-loop NTPases N-terminal domain-containing protein n=1 Tax=Orbilia oligospora TaxID=2813651 RepID=A0A7C8JFL8_ORBOL|nr:hypothetical protein TWF102_005212 [Orbilia oligospora]